MDTSACRTKLVLSPIFKLRHLSFFQRKCTERLQCKSLMFFQSFTSRKYKCLKPYLEMNLTTSRFSLWSIAKFFMDTFWWPDFCFWQLKKTVLVATWYLNQKVNSDPGKAPFCHEWRRTLNCINFIKDHINTIPAHAQRLHAASSSHLCDEQHPSWHSKHPTENHRG